MAEEDRYLLGPVLKVPKRFHFYHFGELKQEVLVNGNLAYINRYCGLESLEFYIQSASASSKLIWSAFICIHMHKDFFFLMEADRNKLTFIGVCIFTRSKHLENNLDKL